MFNANVQPKQAVVAAEVDRNSTLSCSCAIQVHWEAPFAMVSPFVDTASINKEHVQFVVVLQHRYEP